MRKLTMIFLLLLMSFPVKSWDRKKGEFELFINSGGSFPFTTKAFAKYYDPSFIIGGGVGFALSSRLLLRGSFNYYSFFPHEDYHKYLKIGDLIIDISDWKCYIGDHFNSFYNLMIDTQFFLNRHRLSFYITGGIGITWNRKVRGEYVGVEGTFKIIGTRPYFICGVGAGTSYRLNKKFSLFFEPFWVFKYREYYDRDNNSDMILKGGIIYSLRKAKK